LVTNVSAVVQHPVYFGLAGTVAGVIAEGPELFARNAQYANAQYCSLSHGEAQSSDRKVAKCALIGAAVEVLLVALLYYVGYVAHGLSATLGAVALGVAFVAAAEVMSVASTLSVVLRGGRPFRTSW